MEVRQWQILHDISTEHGVELIQTTNKKMIRLKFPKPAENTVKTP